MILPSIEPLDTVVELVEEPRRRCGELLGDLADEPAVFDPAHEDDCANERIVERRWLLSNDKALRQGPLHLPQCSGRGPAAAGTARLTFRLLVACFNLCLLVASFTLCLLILIDCKLVICDYLAATQGMQLLCSSLTFSSTSIEPAKSLKVLPRDTWQAGLCNGS